MRLRRSARVLLFDPDGDILLIRFRAQNNGKTLQFWVTPGGEIESGEEPEEAAARELYEELGLRLPLIGPVHEESGSEYVHLGERVRNEDVFFATVCDRQAPKLAGVTQDEIRLMQEVRWWSSEDLATRPDKVYPDSLAEVAARVWSFAKQQ
jgi:8-oxo-dGTP pyrophosphatase MutT (NUDIX family)